MNKKTIIVGSLLWFNFLFPFLALIGYLKVNLTYEELVSIYLPQLVNVILFLYLFIYVYRIAIPKPSIESKKDELFNEKVSKIVCQIITEEIKTESLKNSEDLKIKELIHEAKTRTSIKELKILNGE
jgi:hypothetical protein